jgi:hypothetical protein
VQWDSLLVLQPPDKPVAVSSEERNACEKIQEATLVYLKALSWH